MDLKTINGREKNAGQKMSLTKIINKLYYKHHNKTLEVINGYEKTTKDNARQIPVFDKGGKSIYV
jgi:hypothetical protein